MKDWTYGYMIGLLMLPLGSAAQVTPLSVAQVYLDSAATLYDSFQYYGAGKMGRKILALNRGQEVVPDTCLIKAYHYIADSFYDRVMLDSAIYYVDKSSALIERSKFKQSIYQADTDHLWGRIYQFREEHEKAQQAFERAEALYLKTGKKTRDKLIETYRFMAFNQELQGADAEAKMFYQKTVRSSDLVAGEKHPNTGRMYEGWGRLSQRNGEYEKAVAYFQKAIAIYLEAGKEQGESLAEAYYSLGVVYTNLAAYSKAIFYTEKTVDAYLEYHKKEDVDLAFIYATLGRYHNLNNDFERAKRFYERALQLRIKGLGMQDSLVADTYNLTANMYYKNEEYDRAFVLFKKALDIRVQLYGENHPIPLMSYVNLGNVLSKKGKHEKVQEYYKKALDASIKIYGAQNYSTATIYNNIGLEYNNIKAYDQAFEYHKKAFDFYEKFKTQRHYTLAKSSCYLGMTEVNRLNYTAAIQHFDKALDAFGYTKSDHENSEFISYILLQTILQKRLAAYLLLDKETSFSYADSIRYLCHELLSFQDDIYLNNPNLAAQKKFAKTSYLVYESAIQFYLQSGTSEDLKKAFQINEKSKSRHLTVHTKKTRNQSFSGIPDSLFEKEIDLNIGVAYYEKLKYKEAFEATTSNDSLLIYYDQQLFQLKNKRDALISVFKKQYPNYYYFKYEHQVAEISTIQQSMQPDQAFIEYFVGSRNLFIFVITKTDFQAKTIKKDFPLDKWVVAMRNGIYEYWIHLEQSTTSFNENKEKYLTTANQLYQKLLHPVADLLPEKLIIIPDGILHFIPFDALLTEAPAESSFRELPYLIKKHQISFNYSASFYDYLQKQEPSQSAQSVLSLAPIFEKKKMNYSSLDDLRRDHGPLLFNRKEAETVAHLFDGTMLEGGQATKQKFIELAKDFKVLHLATHSKSNDASGDYSYIAFQPSSDSVLVENRLYAQELYHLDLDTEMVVLSACESGLGELKQGEGIIGLGSAFVYAGARSTITSLWSVSDVETTVLMKLFYTNLQAGMTKDEALRQAKLEFLKNQQRVAPFFWAGFVPSGNMQAIEYAKKSQRLRYVLLGSILLILIIVFIKRK